MRQLHAVTIVVLLALVLGFVAALAWLGAAEIADLGGVVFTAVGAWMGLSLALLGDTSDDRAEAR